MTYVVSLPKIEGEGFCIRAFNEGDAPSLHRVLNDQEVTERLTNIPYPYNFFDATRWIHSTSTVVTEDSTRVNFAIDIEGEIAGSVSFIKVDMQQENAQLSVWIARKYWKQGLAGKALKLLVEFGFEQMGLYRVSAFHVADNFKTQHLMTTLGFTLEGTHRKEWKKLVDGEYQRFDSLHYALLRDEWERGVKNVR